MKHILFFFLSLYIPSISIAQINMFRGNDQSTISPIMLKNLRINTANSQTILLNFHSQKLPFKFSMNPNVNTSQLQTLDINAANDGIQDIHFSYLFKYDARLKIYLKKRVTLLFQAVIAKQPGNLFMAGIRFKT